jgi:hypothetical protein
MGFWYWLGFVWTAPEFYSQFYDEVERRTLRCRWECWRAGISYAWDGWRREVKSNASR